MPLYINNYNFTNAEYTLPENTLVYPVLPFATLTIVPNPGYTVLAADFSLDPSAVLDPAVQGVTFTQAGLNVLVTVTFVAGFVMPSSNYTIKLCIIGDADVNLIFIGGVYNTIVGDNITPISQSDVAYNSSGSPGQTISLFTKSFSADSGFHMLVSPTAQVIEGNQSNYTINQTPVYNASGELISISYDVLYTFPLEDFLEDELLFVLPKASGIYVPTQLISNWIMPTFVIPESGATRLLNVSGEEGAAYSITLSDGTTTVAIATNVVMDSSGLAQYNIDFLENTTGANVSWVLNISGNLAADLNPNIYVTQSAVVQGTWEPRTSTVLQGGYSVQNTGDYIIEAPEGSDQSLVSIQWLISSNNDLPLSIVQDIGNMPWDNNNPFEREVTQASNGAALISDTSDIEVGMRFSADGSTSAPLDATVTSVLTSSITYTPASVSISEPINVTFTNANGFLFDPSELTAELLDPPISGIVEGEIIIDRFGDRDTTFKLNLDDLFQVVNLTSVLLSTNTKPDEACCNAATEFFIDANTLANATKIFQDNAGQVLAQGSLNYSDGNGYRLWSGTEFSNDIQSCSGNNCGVFGPFTLYVENNGTGDEACCTTTTTTVYLDTNSLNTATTIYLNTDGDPATISGSYSDGHLWRIYDANTNAFTTASATCGGCAQSLILCYNFKDPRNVCCGLGYSVQRWVASGETFANNTGLYMDSGLQNAATLGFYSDSSTCSQNIP